MMLLKITQELMNTFGKKFIGGTITDNELTELYGPDFFKPSEKEKAGVSDRPDDLHHTKMEAMLDFATTIAPHMSENVFLSLIPRLISAEKAFMAASKAGFMRKETLAKYFLVAAAVFFPTKEALILNNEPIKVALLGKPNDAANLALSAEEEASYLALHRNFMRIIWPSKICLLIHMAEDKINQLDTILENTLNGLPLAPKELKKVRATTTKLQKIIDKTGHRIQHIKTDEMSAAIRHLQKAGEMNALSKSLVRLNRKLDARLNKLNGDAKEKSDACSSRPLDVPIQPRRSQSSLSFDSKPEEEQEARACSQSDIRSGDSRRRKGSSLLMWACLFRTPSASLSFEDSICLMSPTSDGASPANPSRTSSAGPVESGDHFSPPPIFPSMIHPDALRRPRPTTVTQSEEGCEEHTASSKIAFC